MCRYDKILVNVAAHVTPDQRTTYTQTGIKYSATFTKILS
jgi:hypothetical protein